MILDLVFVVLLLVILVRLLFFDKKRFASIKKELVKLIKDGHKHSESMNEELAKLIQDGHQYSESIEQELTKLIKERTPDPLPPQIANFNKIRDEFIKYVKRESTILQYRSRDDAYVRYKSGIPNPNGNGLSLIWIQAWMPEGGKISAAISVAENGPFWESHYQGLKANKSKIEHYFSFDNIETNTVGAGIHQFRVNKAGIDLTQTTNWDTEFRWLRENLEKLYWALQIQDIGDGLDAL